MWATVAAFVFLKFNVSWEPERVFKPEWAAEPGARSKFWPMINLSVLYCAGVMLKESEP